MDLISSLERYDYGRAEPAFVIFTAYLMFWSKGQQSPQMQGQF